MQAATPVRSETHGRHAMRAACGRILAGVCSCPVPQARPATPFRTGPGLACPEAGAAQWAPCGAAAGAPALGQTLDPGLVLVPVPGRAPPALAASCPCLLPLPCAPCEAPLAGRQAVLCPGHHTRLIGIAGPPQSLHSALKGCAPAWQPHARDHPPGASMHHCCHHAQSRWLVFGKACTWSGWSVAVPSACQVTTSTFDMLP